MLATTREDLRSSTDLPWERKDAAGGDDDPNFETKQALDQLTKNTLTAIEKVSSEVKQVGSRLSELEKKTNRPSLGGAGPADANAEHKALRTFVRTGNDSELKSMSIGSDPDGGYVVMPVISQTMTKRLFDQSPMRRLSRIETISTGDAWVEPIDIGDIGATWVGEKEARPETATGQLGQLTVPVDEIYAMQPVTQRLLDDSYLNLGGWIEEKISDKFGRSEASACVTGDGVKKPRGFLTYTAVQTADLQRPWGQLQYIKTGGASGFAASNPADVLRDLMWSLRAPYRKDATWQMNSNTASSIDKFKDGQGDYIWRDGMTVGAPPSLLGYPVEINEDMPNLGAGTFPIAFGNFKLGYLIVDKVGIRFLTDPFTSKPNVLFYAYRRVGGNVANFDAIKLLKCEA